MCVEGGKKTSKQAKVSGLCSFGRRGSNRIELNCSRSRGLPVSYIEYSSRTLTILLRRTNRTQTATIVNEIKAGKYHTQYEIGDPDIGSRGHIYEFSSRKEYRMAGRQVEETEAETSKKKRTNELVSERGTTNGRRRRRTMDQYNKE